MNYRVHVAAITIVLAIGVGHAKAADEFNPHHDKSTTQFGILSGVPAKPLAEGQLADIRGADVSLWVNGQKLQDIPGRVNNFEHGALCVGGGPSVFVTPTHTCF